MYSLVLEENWQEEMIKRILIISGMILLFAACWWISWNVPADDFYFEDYCDVNFMDITDVNNIDQ